MSPHADPLTGLCSAYTARYLAAMERQQTMLVQLTSEHLLDKHRSHTGGRDGVRAHFRSSLGSAFLRVRAGLRGQTTVAPA